MNRRTFLQAAATGMAAASLPAPIVRSARALSGRRVLILGGTNYVGPHLVRAALEAGAEVTLFNRGYTNAHLFPHVEHLLGNRLPDRPGGLAALGGDRTWDLVIDTWAYEPGAVHEAARLLAGRVGRYVYISSIAVLGGYRDVGLDEASPTVDAAAHVASFDPALDYATLKRAGELAVLDAFGDRATVLRGTSIYGYDAAAGLRNQQLYWPLRFLSGEPVLAPDDDAAVIQWTDARDVGRFALHALERELGGIFHLINPAEPALFRDYLLAWHAATGHRSRLVFAPRAFLNEHGIQPWVDLPVYIPADDPEPGFFRISARKAHETGFTFRPLGETIADVIRSFPTAPAPEAAEGLDRRRELDLIWRLEAGAGG